MADADTDLTRECAELRAAVRELTTQLANAESHNAELDRRLHAAEQQRANYSPPSCDRLRDEG